MSLSVSPVAPAELASLAAGIRNAGSITAAAEILLHAGRVVELPTPTFVDDVRSDRPVEIGKNANLAQSVLGWHPTMLRWWYGDRVGLRHPDVQRATSLMLPYSSLVYDGQLEELSEEARHIRRYMNGWGLRSQLLIPVHLPRGTSSLVGWASARQGAVGAVSSEHSFGLMAVAYAFVDTVERCRGSRSIAPHGLLSLRQRECLSWMAKGRSVKEVAIILGLSPHTVRDYLKDAAKRVNARSRSQLLSIAMTRGELDDLSVTH